MGFLIFLSDFYDVSMGLLWGFYWIHVGFPLYVYDISMGLLWNFYWVSMVALWKFMRISQGCLWDTYRISMGFSWISMGLLWHFYGSPGVVFLLSFSYTFCHFLFVISFFGSP